MDRSAPIPSARTKRATPPTLNRSKTHQSTTNGHGAWGICRALCVGGGKSCDGVFSARLLYLTLSSSVFRGHLNCRLKTVALPRYSALPVSNSLYTSAIAALCTMTQYAKTYTKTAALHPMLTPSSNMTAIPTAPDEPATTNANPNEGGSLLLEGSMVRALYPINTTNRCRNTTRFSM